MRFVLTTLILLLGACGGSSSSKHPTPAAEEELPLRTDGIYVTAIDTEYDSRAWLRFYGDGTVLSVSTSSDATAQDLSSWFGLSLENVSKGEVTRVGNDLEFSSAAKEGVVDYKGRITSEHIEFDTVSHINGNRAHAEYHFEPITFSVE